MGIRWRVGLTARAEQDIADISAWTVEHFGFAQAEKYSKMVRQAVRELENGPDPPGAKRRDDVLPGLRTLHVARYGRRGRHFVVYCEKRNEERMVIVLRILHDQMDLPRHILHEK